MADFKAKLKKKHWSIFLPDPSPESGGINKTAFGPKKIEEFIFRAYFWPFLGHIVKFLKMVQEIEGKKRFSRSRVGEETAFLARIREL